jgi:hypothetical protein
LAGPSEPQLLKDSALLLVLTQCQRALRFAVVRIGKARSVAAAAASAFEELSRQTKERLSSNPSLDAVDRECHQPRVNMPDAVAYFIDMMDQVEVESQLADNALSSHVERLDRIARALDRRALTIGRHLAAVEKRMCETDGRSPIRQPPTRSLDADPLQMAAQRDVRKANTLVEAARCVGQAAIDASQERTARCEGSEDLMWMADHVRKLDHAPRATGCPPRTLELAWGDDTTYGLRWTNVGSTRPKTGRQLKNNKLASALCNQMRFSRAELELFGVIGELRRCHYVKAGTSYFRPEAATIGGAEPADDRHGADAWVPPTAWSPPSSPPRRTAVAVKRVPSTPTLKQPSFVRVSSDSDESPAASTQPQTPTLATVGWGRRVYV